MAPMVLDDITTEGIRDRIIEGFLGRFVDIEGIRRGDPVAIAAAAKTLAGLMGYGPEFSEVNDVIQEAIAKDYYGAVYQLGDAMMKFAGPKANPPYPSPSPVITTMARKPLKEMTAAECETWCTENKAGIREGANFWAVEKALRHLPEVLAGLKGELTVSQLETMALDPEQVIKWLKRAIFVCTAAAAIAATFFPAAAPLIALVVTALRMLLIRYESQNPDVGLPLTALAA